MLILKQFFRFATVGALGILIDFGILNLLSWIFGITKGNGIIPLNAVSFGSALIVTFLLNKHWTFKDLSRGDNIRKLNLYMMVSILGLVINTGIVKVITDYVSPADIGAVLSDRVWLNVAKSVATVFSGSWNFINYKLNVFKK